MDRSCYRGWGEARAEVLEYLQDGPKSTREINELMGRGCASLMANLLKDSVVEVIGRRKYGVRSWVRVYALAGRKK